jgi:hypothetical protein
MPAKHNCKHPERGRSNYRNRLTARGLAKAPAMEALEGLRKRQERRVELTGVPWAVSITDADTDAEAAA